jgi:malate/lactate dehydrogenase
MAANYEIRIKGRVGDSLLVAFEGLSVDTEPVETILHGPVRDQEALHELLAKIQSLGLEVVELRRLPAAGPQSDA